MNGYLSKPVSARDLRTICSLFYIVPVKEDASFTATGKELPILDAEETLANLGGVHALYYELLDMFARQAPHLITELANHIHTGDIEGTKRHLRSLISSAANIGARRIVHLCRYIQSSVDNGNLDDCKEWSEQLPHQLELLLDTITTVRRADVC